MKNIKVLSALVAVTLLAGCNASSKASFKAYKYSKEVSCAEINERYDADFEKAGIPKDFEPVDFKFDGASKYELKEAIEFNGKERETENISEIMQYTAEFDKDTTIAHTNIEGSLEVVATAGYGVSKYNVKQSDKLEAYAQEVEQQGDYELTIVRASDNRYTASTNGSATLYPEFMMRSMNNSGYTYCNMPSTSSYDAMSNDEKAQYKFYIDSDILTVTRKYEATDSEEYATALVTGETISQWKIEKGKISFYYEQKASQEVTYTANYGSRVAGEKTIEAMNMAAKGTFSFAEVKLQMVDISNMIESTNDLGVSDLFALNNLGL